MDRLLACYVGLLVELTTLGRRLEARLPAPNAAQRGSGILEYCLIAAIVAIGLLGVLVQFTSALSGVFTRIMGRLGGLG